MTTELQIQSFLRAAPDFETAERQLLGLYAIKAKRSLVHPELVLFKYSQIDSPFAERIVQECRGIILCESDNWRVVSRSFDKFFNYGEGLAAEIDWGTARVLEKVDGSLLTIYFYKGKWLVQTTGTADASGNVETLPETFADLFWRTYETAGLSNPKEAARGHSFMFELTSPFNRIVVNHTETGLTLLGARNLETGEEISPFLAVEAFEPGRRPRVVQRHWLESFDEINLSFPAISPLVSEGYVVCDAHFNRVKCKNPAYIALHHAKDGLSFRSMLDVARRGETSEVESAFPELKVKLHEMRGRVELLTARLEGAYSSIAHIESQKDFALCAQKTKCPAALFQLRAKKVDSIAQYLAVMNVDHLGSLLGYSEAA